MNSGEVVVWCFAMFFFTILVVCAMILRAYSASENSRDSEREERKGI